MVALAYSTDLGNPLSGGTDHANIMGQEKYQIFQASCPLHGYGAFRILLFQIGQCLLMLVFFLAYHVTHTNIHNVKVVVKD